MMCCGVTDCGVLWSDTECGVLWSDADCGVLWSDTDCGVLWSDTNSTLHLCCIFNDGFSSL